MMKNHMNQVARNMNNLRTMNRYYNNHPSTNLRWEFIIKYNDSTQVTVYSKFHFDETKNSYYLEDKNSSLPKTDTNRVKKIYPWQTLSVERLDAVWNEMVFGEPVDSCWLFLVMRGKINVFSFFSEESSVSNGAIAAIQFDFGPLEKFDAAKLQEYIKDNVKAMAAFNKKDYYNAIRVYNKKQKGKE
jgi:hypothetical protein